MQINNDLLILNKHINESIYLLNLIDWFNLFLKTITVLVNNKIIMFNLLSLTIFSFQFFVFYIYYKSESAADLAGRISSYSSERHVTVFLIIVRVSLSKIQNKTQEQKACALSPKL